MQSKLFLVDVDGTLIDTQKLKVAIGERFAEKFGEGTDLKLWEIYQEIIKKNGFLDINELADTLASELKITDPSLIKNVFLEASFKDYLFPGALETLKNLKGEGKVIIYSQGENLYQPIKIKKSGIEEVVGTENVIISQNKAEHLLNIKEEIDRENYDEITIIDNLPSFLESAGKVFPEAKLVLASEGKYNI